MGKQGERTQEAKVAEYFADGNLSLGLLVVFRCYYT